MILSGKEISREIGESIIIDPFEPSQINPNSYNLRLDNTLYVYTSDVLDMRKEEPVKKMTIPEGGFLLEPNTLYLGQTYEHTETKRYVPMLEGRSSIGRLGLFIHVSAGFGDVGFSGKWTLEMYCVKPLKIYPFVKICQIFYHTIQGSYELYDNTGKYQHSQDPSPSKLFQEFL